MGGELDKMPQEVGALACKLAKTQGLLQVMQHALADSQSHLQEAQHQLHGTHSHLQVAQQ